MSKQSLGKIFAVSMLLISLSGCMSLGPRTIAPDRVDYVNELSESWKKQMLLNIVKLRYFDTPTFLDVSSVINQYGIESQINADAHWYWPFDTSNSAGVGGYARYSDKPTITYTPLAGQKFTRNLLTPIPPNAVVSLVQGGWPIDVIFSFAVKTVNGVNNVSVRTGVKIGDEDFNRLLKALRTVQDAGVTDIRVEKIDDKESVVFVIADSDKTAQYRDELQTIRRVLKIKADASSYRVVFGALARNDTEIALLTRSVLEIMMEMGSTVDVPRPHVDEKWVKAIPAFSGENALTHIYSSREKPQEAYTTVRYLNYWFRIDNNDVTSKRNFALLMIFLSLTDTETKGSGPLLTIGG